MRSAKILFVIVYSIAFGEAYSRWLVPEIIIGSAYTVSDPELGWVGRRSFVGRRVTREFDMRFTTGVEGFRGTDRVDKKAEDSFRIVSLGDSHTFGAGVNDDEVYSQLLEQKLDAHATGATKDIEVINMSVPDGGTGLMLAMWDRILGYEPNAIVVRYGDHNFRVPRELWGLDGGKLVRAAPGFQGSLVGVIESLHAVPNLESSALYGFVRILLWRHAKSITSLGTRLNPFKIHPPAKSLHLKARPPAKALEYHLLGELVNRCVERRIPLVFATFRLAPDRRAAFERIVDRPGIYVLNLDTRKESPQFYFPLDGHLNVLGHEYVATELAGLFLTHIDIRPE